MRAKQARGDKEWRCSTVEAKAYCRKVEWRANVQVKRVQKRTRVSGMFLIR